MFPKGIAKLSSAVFIAMLEKQLADSNRELIYKRQKRDYLQIQSWTLYNRDVGSSRPILEVKMLGG